MLMLFQSRAQQTEDAMAVDSTADSQEGDADADAALPKALEDVLSYKDIRAKQVSLIHCLLYMCRWRRVQLIGVCCRLEWLMLRKPWVRPTARWRCSLTASLTSAWAMSTNMMTMRTTMMPNKHLKTER